MFNFNSTMGTGSQCQNPNPYNPNCDHEVPYVGDQFTDSPYFDIANYLMSNEDERFEKNILLKNKNVYESGANCCDGSSNSTPLARNIKCRREMKKYKTQEEVRFAFRTKTDLEFMDDGYKWRKYGKKMVKNSPNPRNYFKCSSGGCSVKKRVQRDRDDPSYVITTYQGIHNHETPNFVLYCSPQPSNSLLLSSSSM
ncbi:hypothetical protein Pfo_018662 [Paulownia fortunei]|nr:hypothetical protein Pfo_018662 [Paulownia fortunei]